MNIAVAGQGYNIVHSPPADFFVETASMSEDASFSLNSSNLKYIQRTKKQIREMFANNFGNFRNVECGLVHLKKQKGIGRSKHQDDDEDTDDESSDSNSSSFSSDREDFIPIPLKSVSVVASVVHAVAQVEITQVYVNKEPNPIEVIYFFPVDSNGAVTHFQAELDGRTVKGVVKPNEEAKAQYNKAMKNNQTAFLGEENKPDIFKVSIGHLKPGTEVKVIIGYVTEVKNEPNTNSIRFFLPTTIAPRYIPGFDSDAKTVDLSKMVHSDVTPASMKIKIIASVQGEISSIESPTHEITIENKGLIPEKEHWHKWLILLDGNTTQMDKDFVLMITPKEATIPRLYSETIEGGSTAVMAHFIPSFNLDEQKVELIFLLDRSGSMDGQSILMAQKALMLLIHSMPADCYFNIIGFGSSYKLLFPKSRKYDDASLKLATKYAGNLRADMGGTEILAPLEEIYKIPEVSGYIRQIFVVTDGEVSNTDSIIGLVKANAHKSRVFALGIGNSASHYLVEGIAQAGGGTCVFVGSDENIQKQALGQLKNALQPALSEIKVEWKGIENNSSQPPPVLNKEKTLVGYNKPIEPATDIEKLFIQAPRKIPAVFDGNQLVVFGVFPKDKPTGAIITAESPDGPLILNIELSEENDIGSTKMLHRLAAIKIVRELELDETETGSNRGTKSNIKKEIIKVAVENGISSKYTSFVAVVEAEMETATSNELSWMMQTRHVPSQFPAGFQSRGQFYSSGNTKNTARKSTYNFQINGRHPRKQLATQAARKCASAAPMCSSPRSPAKSSYRKTTAHASIRVTRSSKRARSPENEDGGNLPSAPPLKTTGFYGASRVVDLQDDSGSDTPMEITSAVVAVPTNHEGTRNVTLHLVYNIINLQSFQGSFPLNPALSNIIGFDINFLKAESLKGGWDEAAWATSLAIVFLTENLLEWKDYWELVVTKAQKWIELNHLHSKDAMISAARSTINLRRTLCN